MLTIEMHEALVAYWDANKQAAEPFDQHLGEAFCILFR